VDKRYHLTRQPIPAGFRIYEEGIAIAGLDQHAQAARDFCKADDPRLEFAPEPQNAHDKTAIAIIGTWRSWFARKPGKLGYVPRDIAGRLAAVNLASTVRPRLLKTYLGPDAFVDIEFQIVGPADRFRDYRPITEEDPMTQVKHAKANGDHETAMNILADMITAGEARSKADGEGVAPLPYLEASKILRRLELHDEEFALLERYEAQTKASGSLPIVLAERLDKLRKQRDRPAQAKARRRDRA